MSNDVAMVLWSSAGWDRSAEGLAGGASRLAANLGGKLHALLIGPKNEGIESKAAAVSDSVVRADHDALKEYQPENYLKAATDLCSKLSPRAILLANDSYSQELAPRLAHRLKGSAVGDAAEIIADGGAIKVRRSAYGGKAVALVELKRNPAVVWIRTRAQAAAAERPTKAAVEPAALDISGASTIRFLERQSEARAGVRLEDASVIVSGGRGLGGPEPFADLQKLAEVMKAQVGASRAACDAGWVPPTWQVGQTGKKVAPSLYLAVAISGASQHLIGIADAKVIAAINTDPEAPIYKHCRFGLVEDFRKVLGPLQEKLKTLKG